MASSQLSTTPPESPRDHDEDDTECGAFDVLEILGDEYTQKILAVLAQERVTGSELIERADVSKATAYRRLDDLQEADVVESSMRLDPNGHHCEEYYISVETLLISFGNDGFDVERTGGDCDQPVGQPAYRQAGADD